MLTQKFYLPHNIKMQMRYLAKDFNRLSEKLDELLEETARPDGQPTGNRRSDPVCGKVLAREKVRTKLAAMAWAKQQLPEPYREVVFCSYAVTNFEVDDIIDRKIFKLLRQMYLYKMAKYLNEI